MNEFIFVDILRSFVSNVFNTMLMFQLAKPKYGKKATVLAFCGIILAGWFSIYFYVFLDFTILSKVGVLYYLISGLAIKPLFKDSWPQWCFNIITMMNIYASIVILSYRFSLFFPYSIWMNLVLRVFLFSVVIYFFRRFIRPFYQKILEHWRIIFLLAVVVFANFGYYFLSSNDIVSTMVNSFVPLMFIIVLSVVVYVTVFFFMKKTSEEYDLREENLRAQARHNLLKEQLDAQDLFITVSRQTRHDIHHHNMVLSEYLSTGDIAGAQEYLRQYDESIEEENLHHYCSNQTVNAILRLYGRRAASSDITFSVRVDLPEVLPVTEPELACVLSNLLENAYEACMKVEMAKREIVFTATSNDVTLNIETRNCADSKVFFQGIMPQSTKENGGIGTKSIVRIVEKHKGLVRFLQNGDTFISQIVLPLKLA